MLSMEMQYIFMCAACSSAAKMKNALKPSDDDLLFAYCRRV